jgi:hypothetical protein
MKKPMLVLLIAAILNIPAAEAILVPLPGGGLQSGYTIRVLVDTDTAVMLQAVIKSRLELEGSLTVSAGTSIDIPVTIPSRTNRIILVLDPAMFGQFLGDVTVTILDQNLNPIIPPLVFNDPHIELVFEAAP